MKITLTYSRIEARRSLKMVAGSMLSILILLVVTGLGVFGIQRWMENSKNYDRILVGVGLEEGDDTTEFFAKIVSGMESVRAACEFRYMDIEEARLGVSDNEIDVAILLPAGFYEDVDTGVNTPVSVLFAENSGFHTDVFVELLQDGVSLVQITEAGVYAAGDVGNTHAMTMRRGKMQEFLSLLYMEAAYKRESAFDRCILSETGELDVNRYYFITGVLFFVLMGGCVFRFFYQGVNGATEKMLTFYGMGPIKRSLVQILLMTGYLYVALLLCVIAGFVVSAKTGWMQLNFEPFMVAAMLGPALSMACYFHGIYGVFRDKGSLVLILVNGIMFVLSGGFVPAVYFPGWTQTLGKALPLTYWMDYFREALFGDDYALSFLPLLVITCIFGIAGTIGRCKHT